MQLAAAMNMAAAAPSGPSPRAPLASQPVEVLQAARLGHAICQVALQHDIQAGAPHPLQAMEGEPLAGLDQSTLTIPASGGAQERGGGGGVECRCKGERF